MPETGAIAAERGQRGRPSPERIAEIDAAILATATELFLREGYEGTLMDMVATRAGVPRRTLYRRYADKSALLGAVLEARRAEWAKAAAGQSEPRSERLEERLAHHVAITLQWASTAEIRAFLRVTAGAIGDTGGRFRRDELFGFTIMVDRMTSDIATYGPGQGFDARDPETLAFTLMTMIAGWIELRQPAEALTAEQARAHAAYLVDLVVRGKAAW